MNFPELAADLPAVLERMAANQVTHALVVSVNMPEWPGLMDLVRPQRNLWASVGVHPDYEDTPDPQPEELVRLAQDPKVVAIGETGLDYYRLSEPLDWQRERFRRHIRAARSAGLPLIIHTRSSAEDTVRILKEEGADEIGGVMHCFTETWEIARAALDLNFHISLSGIVTFKNAGIVHEVARNMPLDRLLIETDSPYLAPVPYRGKLNDPSKVIHVAEKIAELQGRTVAEVAHASTENFFKLFSKIVR
ncbi:hydrolase, TatD family protein [Bordetella holmesii 41130]|uniref:Hydrolase, TatD family protein n=1 Tax=Bordetella holmesii 1058 TaxID=1247648 RepID=A0ABN0RYJ2_9BORD|nr:hydrolase, TatD family protein [Bordetella holmesii ATCC 51541]AIT28067.1 hydrolase, TatD family protein [Bordetella holmesii 44057]EWM40848.1 hydrolase, TatD family protein [Bordetella holmesii 35009]EWM42445.1 hydrolase, TatD family protein [Bordetella holmesii 41130]EWM44744.1 hydrolase, TatD family protein [Bordetella holmesii 70147]EXX94077.1 hydrolase, TatD family protein [Bordetella holmesii 1058]